MTRAGSGACWRSLLAAALLRCSAAARRSQSCLEPRRTNGPKRSAAAAERHSAPAAHAARSRSRSTRRSRCASCSNATSTSSRLRSADEGRDLDEAEWTRLIAAAPAQARALLETEGYFDAAGAASSARPAAAERAGCASTPGPRATRRARDASRCRASCEARRRSGRRRGARRCAKRCAATGRCSRASRSATPTGAARRTRAGAAARRRLCRRRRWTGTGAQVDADTQQCAAVRRRRQRAAVPGRRPAHRRPVAHDEAHRAQSAPASSAARRSPRHGCSTSRSGCKAGLFDGVSVALDPDPANAGRGAGARARAASCRCSRRPLGVGISANTGPRASLEHTAPARLRLGRDVAQQVRVRPRPQVLGRRAGDAPAAGLLPQPGRRAARAARERRRHRALAARARRPHAGHAAHRAAVLRRRPKLDATASPAPPRATGDVRRSRNYHGVWRDLDSIAAADARLHAVAGRAASAARAAPTPKRGPFAPRSTAASPCYRPFGTLVRAGPARARPGVRAPTASAVPDTLVFRAGGDDSVRGYGYRTLAPPKRDGVVTSGNVLGTGSVEIARPVVEQCRRCGARCSSTPATRPTAGTSSTPALGYGVGVRWRSPVGPAARRLRLRRGGAQVAPALQRRDRLL